MLSRRVLIIEDDADAAGVLEAYLRRENYDVVVTVDGLAGLDMAQRWPHARQCVLTALWPLTHEETLLKRTGYPQAQALVTHMVQESSRQLAALGALG